MRPRAARSRSAPGLGPGAGCAAWTLAASSSASPAKAQWPSCSALNTAARRLTLAALRRALRGWSRASQLWNRVRSWAVCSGRSEFVERRRIGCQVGRGLVSAGGLQFGFGLFLGVFHAGAFFPLSRLVGHAATSFLPHALDGGFDFGGLGSGGVKVLAHEGAAALAEGHRRDDDQVVHSGLAAVVGCGLGAGGFQGHDLGPVAGNLQRLDQAQGQPLGRRGQLHLGQQLAGAGQILAKGQGLLGDQRQQAMGMFTKGPHPAIDFQALLGDRKAVDDHPQAEAVLNLGAQRRLLRDSSSRSGSGRQDRWR